MFERLGARQSKPNRQDGRRAPCEWPIKEVTTPSFLVSVDSFDFLFFAGPLMSYWMHTTPNPDPLADPTRDPEGEPLVPPSPGHHNDEPQRPEGPPDKDPV